ncbi:MAG TPA: electron transfer flavoprotein subunit beta/FixA family protein [Clostridiales bacterium]|jgi:electron transfer flavoprotein beta subunit|nr:electron transfer flavoprotein subunit beta/FixA family protein [Clostridiales bacterium]
MGLNIIVCAKQVPDTTEVKTDPVKNTLIRDGVPSILNPDDANALEEALRIKDEHPDSHITVVTMGPPQARHLLLECLAMGADQGVLVSDRALGGSDTWATSNALAAAVNKLGEYDLIFTGRQAIDGDTAQVGPQLAERLGLPQVTYVTEFKLEGREVTVKRALEDGYELIKLQLPCVLTAIKELNNPRHMTIPGIYDAVRSDIPVWGVEELKIDPDKVGLEASPTNIFRSFMPAPKSKGIILEYDTAEEAARILVEKLNDRNVIA